LSVSDQLHAYNEGLHGTIDVGNGRQARGSLRTPAECRMLCDLLIYERSWLDRLHRHSLFPTNVTTPISSMLLSSCCFSSKFLVHSYSLSFPFFLLLSRVRYPTLYGSVFPITVRKTTRIVCAMGTRFSHHLPLPIGLIPPDAPNAAGRTGTLPLLCVCVFPFLLAVLIFARNRKVWALALFLFFFFPCTSSLSIISSPLSLLFVPNHTKPRWPSPIVFRTSQQMRYKPHTTNAFNDHATGVSATGRKDDT